jgi:hypothetical protein
LDTFHPLASQPFHPSIVCFSLLHQYPQTTGHDVMSLVWWSRMTKMENAWEWSSEEREGEVKRDCTVEVARLAQPCMYTYMLAAATPHPLLALPLPLSANYSSRGWPGPSLSLSLTLILSRARLFSVINSDDPCLPISLPLPHAALLRLLI